MQLIQISYQGCNKFSSSSPPVSWSELRVVTCVVYIDVFIFITWYKADPGWTHALEGPHAHFTFECMGTLKSVCSTWIRLISRDKYEHSQDWRRFDNFRNPKEKKPKNYSAVWLRTLNRNEFPLQSLPHNAQAISKRSESKNSKRSKPLQVLQLLRSPRYSFLSLWLFLSPTYLF